MQAEDADLPPVLRLTMFPTFKIFGRTFASYGFFSVLGFLLSLLFIIVMSPRLDTNRENAVYIYVLTVIGGLIGAKVLYLLTVWPAFVSDFLSAGRNFSAFIAKYSSGGMVFYGGLIGGIPTAILVSRSYHTKLTSYFRVFVPAVLLFFGFGRIGCFCAGCCYGKETDLPFSVVFTHSPVAPNGVPLIPTQLFEAAFDFLLFFILLFICVKLKNGILALEIYLTAYSLFRFTIEFFRGDAIRGRLLDLSTSQWISAVVFTVTMVWILKRPAGALEERRM